MLIPVIAVPITPVAIMVTIIVATPMVVPPVAVAVVMTPIAGLDQIGAWNDDRQSERRRRGRGDRGLRPRLHGQRNERRTDDKRKGGQHAENAFDRHRHSSMASLKGIQTG